MKASVLLVVLLSAFPVALQAAGNRLAGNPIRKVVSFLQSYSKEAEKELEVETKLYDKFMCYCKTQGAELKRSIGKSNDRVPELESGIESANGKKSQLVSKLVSAKATRAEAAKSMAEATSIREKDAKAHAKEMTEARANKKAIHAGIAQMKRQGKSFLQTSSAEQLRKLVDASNAIDGPDRQDVLAFLSGAAPGQTQVVGILQEMSDEYEREIKAGKKAEGEAIQMFNQLMHAKKKEAKVASEIIEGALLRNGETAVELTTMTNELEDTKDQLGADSKLMAALDKSCSNKRREYTKTKNAWQAMLLGLAETIKVLNDDDALELFKKTLPNGGGASFLQVQVTEHSLRARVRRLLKAGKRSSPTMSLISMALAGKKVGLAGVGKMIVGLEAALDKEQTQDEKKKDYCNAELDKADDKAKDVKRTLSDNKLAISKAKNDVQSIEEELSKLMAGVRELDKSVAEASVQRKQENAVFKKSRTERGQAKEMLRMAKGVLKKMYANVRKAHQASLLQSSKKADVLFDSPDQDLLVEMGLADKPQAPSFVQVQSHQQEAPLSKMHDNRVGVNKMLDMLIADLDKQAQEAAFIERDSQEDYEEAMQDASDKRKVDMKSFEESKAVRADLQAELQELRSSGKSINKELMLNQKYGMSLHADCDFLLQYFNVRMKARTDEIDALKKSRAVLSGADYSFF